MDKIMYTEEELKSKSIDELFELLPDDAIVGRTIDGYRGGFLCCSYYAAAHEYPDNLNEAPEMETPDSFGTSIKGAMIGAIVKL